MEVGQHLLWLPWLRYRNGAVCVPLDARGLARLLDPYEITPAKVKVVGRSLQGYRAEHLADAWTRYLPPIPAETEPAEPPEPEPPP